MNYRREIDGLRAVAVLPVILFHAGIGFFKGGFVGVDIFFVISGYLITAIIIEQIRAGTFSLSGFYERRARRILPALFLVMLVCIPFAWLWLLPTELRTFSMSMASVTVFASNMFFWQESGYFDTVNEFKPLIHTWSLAVEEQYYLVYPVLLFVILRLPKYVAIIVFLLVMAFSMAVAESWLETDVSAAFYLFPTRAWELLFGALAAYVLTCNKVVSWNKCNSLVVRESLSVFGLVLIVYAVTVFDRSTPFPGGYALVPTIGAVLVIVFATSETFVAAMLGKPLLVWIGLISYSAYLWHQPLFAFARARSSAALDDVIMLALSLLTLVIAYVSWRFIETPFRRKDGIGSVAFIKLALSTGFLFFVLGIIGYATSGFPGRLPGTVQWESLGHKINTQGSLCKRERIDGFDRVLGCYFGDKSSGHTVALYGDSHSVMLLAELDKSFKASGIRGVWIEADGCRVIPGLIDANHGLSSLNHCMRSYQMMLDYFVDNVSGVIVVARWTFQLYPIPGLIDTLGFDNQEGGVEIETPRKVGVLGTDGVEFGASLKRDAIHYLIRSMLHSVKKLVLVYPVPEVGWNIAKENMRYYQNSGLVLPQLSTLEHVFISRNKFVLDALDAIPDAQSLVRIRPANLFCGNVIQGRCMAQINGVPLYYDDDHLSDAGAAILVSEIMRSVDWREASGQQRY